MRTGDWFVPLWTSSLQKRWSTDAVVKMAFAPVHDGPVGLDYVADLGDGFDSTYAIAYLLGQREIEIGENRLPRAQCLVMGGDQVYPDASRDDYWKRMQRPYEAAFPRSDDPAAERPPVFLIPGNP